MAAAGPRGSVRTPSSHSFYAFLVVTLAAAWAAWLVWNASRAGGVRTLVLLPVEAAFWFGFDLPIPKAIGLLRAVLLVLGWTSLH